MKKSELLKRKRQEDGLATMTGDEIGSIGSVREALDHKSQNDPDLSAASRGQGGSVQLRTR